MLNMNAPMEVAITVDDLPRALHFYQDLLGLTKISEITLNEHGSRMAGLGEHGYTVVRLQTPYGERIKLVCPPVPPAQATPADAPAARAGIAYVTFLVANLDEVMAKLSSAGINSSKGTVTLRPGVRIALVRDPEGNFIEFAQYDNIAAYRADLAIR